MHASCRLPCFLSVCSLPCLLIQAAELQLVHEPQGTFIIRPSSQVDQLSLTVRSPPSPSEMLVKHFILIVALKDGLVCYKMSGKQDIDFPTVEELIDYYSQHPLSLLPDGQPVYCIRPKLTRDLSNL
eukprot:m.75035 g.75035  ORF g.75035 m.75035 type:complete len:127 (-) comp14391_c0_seq5:28-408(-)